MAVPCIIFHAPAENIQRQPAYNKRAGPDHHQRAHCAASRLAHFRSGEARETEAYFLLIYAEDPKQFLFLPKKAYENPALARPITWEISEEQITAKDQLSQINYQWSVFRPVPETEEFFFLIFSADKNQFFYFPKRVITSPGNMDRFRELARRRLG